MSTSRSRSVLSDPTPSQTSNLILEPQFRSNFISPSPGALVSSTITTPHPLRRPSAAMPNPIEVETCPQDMDDVSETSTIHSAVSQTSQDILIPTPPMSDYGAFIEWLGYHFAAFITDEFEGFLLEKMALLSLKDLSDFITTCVPKTLHESIGSRMYDANRQSIIDLKIIWYFIQQAYRDGQATGSYNAFMNLREKMLVRTATLFPHSEVYTRPTPVYRSVSSVVGNQVESLRNHFSEDSRFYSANVTPDSVLTSPGLGIRKSPPSGNPHSDSTRYKASSPRMVFPASELSFSEHGGSQPERKPSSSSLFLDRYTERASTSYVPPHAKSTKSSEHQS